MPTSPNTSQETLTGIGAEQVEVSSQYMTNVITIVGLATGVVTVRAKEQSNNVFESVVNGNITLSTQRTITIKNVQLDAFEFTLEPSGTAYTVKVKQYDPIL